VSYTSGFESHKRSLVFVEFVPGLAASFIHAETRGGFCPLMVGRSEKVTKSGESAYKLFAK
jgi:hypothetical protein